MLKKRRDFKEVYLKEEVYVLGSYNNDEDRFESIEKYSLVNRSWSYVFDLPDKLWNFCACAFTNEIYIFNGCSHRTGCLNSCLEFDAKELTCKQIAKMNGTRKHSAREVFKGNIVVSGGYNNYNNLKSVDLYDVLC